VTFFPCSLEGGPFRDPFVNRVFHASVPICGIPDFIDDEVYASEYQ
jgi:hypothetical protein